MNIVGQTKKFVTTRLLSNILPKHKKLFAFGIQALTVTPYESLGSNARMVVENISTAASKMYRLVSNKKIVATFHRLVRESGLVTKTSLVNVDFSTFCGFQALCFGVQTGEGRALPVWNASLTYPIKFIGSQNLFVLDQIKLFGKTLEFYPRFVFDRGFWIPCVMRFLLQRKILFYLRIKQGQTLYWTAKGEKQLARTIGKHTKDATIELFGYKLRLVVSPPPPKQTNPKKKQNTQRWYILTNDMDTPRVGVLKIYATRFEIEETFKDHKHIQKLKTLRIKTIRTFTILLWFASIAQWLAWWIQADISKKNERQVHPKKKRSFFRIFWEELQRALREEGLKRIAILPASG
jgi:Transposase DDE domain